MSDVPRKSQRRPPLRSPVHLGPVSNGEYAPTVGLPGWREAERRVVALTCARAGALGLSRRQALTGPLGVAISLHVINQLAGCAGKDDGGYAVDSALRCDEDGARALLSGPEFVFDVQTHHVDDAEGAAWTQDAGFRAFFNYISSSLGCAYGDLSCVNQGAYIEEVFVRSETTVAVLSSLPAPDAGSPLSDRLIDETRLLVNDLAASQRLLTHAIVRPDQGAAALEAMPGIVEDLGPAAWKIYTPHGPGWFLDDTTGLAFLEQVMQTGPRIVCCHKGLPLLDMSEAHASPRDVGPAAAAFPELAIVVYHSGYDTQVTEGPYDPAGQGVDRLVRSLAEAGVGPGENVYAELGATWHSLMTRPEQAAHVLGKLLLAVGEDNVLWGTDCVWYGSPQAQIDAFRAFTISEALQEAHGYPALSEALKAKVLGLNAARLYGVDPEAARCGLADDRLALWRDRSQPWRGLGPRVYGPVSRREWLRRGRA